jgi:outer membrane lipoprotein SlyB
LIDVPYAQQRKLGTLVLSFAQEEEQRHHEVFMNSENRNQTDVVTGAEPHLSRVDYDAEPRMHNERLRRTYGAFVPTITSSTSGAGPGRRGTPARLAVAGSVVGVDISAPLIELARSGPTGRESSAQG